MSEELPEEKIAREAVEEAHVESPKEKLLKLIEDETAKAEAELEALKRIKKRLAEE